MAIMTDTAGLEVGYIPIALTAGQDSAPFSLLITPESAGESLRSILSPDATVLARRTGSGASFVDIYAAPVSLASYLGQTIGFDFKIRASAAVTGVRRVGQFIGVTKSGAADWLH